MKRIPLYVSVIICFVITDAYSQRAAADSSAGNIFVGSTPCDQFIKASLKIPADEKCEFIKWKLTLDQGENNSDRFQFTALYGESQPNTNGFIGGGTRIEITGKYTITKDTRKHPAAKVYELNDSKLQSPICLIKMDNNIFLFADAARNLLIGNAGFSYVLNRVKN